MRGVVAAVVLLLALSSPAGAQIPDTGESIPAPATRLSADGRSATDGVRTLTVSQAAGLDPAGETVTVTGSGYDTVKGIYVAFCLIPPTNQPPTPCGGGIDQSGTGGASQWISSNPPPAGVGVAQPYGPGGSFSVTITVAAKIQNVDCTRVRCAIVTRNDHTRSTDRSQDIFVPISFATAAAPTTAAPPAAAPAAPATPAPVATVPEPTTVAPVTTPETVAPTTAAPSTTDALPTTVPDARTAREVAGVPVSNTGDDAGGFPAGVITIGVVLVVAVAVATFFVVRARRSAP